ncbi:MAG TPA: thioredoxin family protein [Cyclobacteriaceae bacterium]|nr:thioredoxin family protein [Cyclobacteriaceae bacterium]
MKRIVLSVVAVLALIAGAPVKNGYEVGDIVADFSLKSVDGKMVSLSNFKDAKGFIVVFDCNTCPVSKRYNQRIIDLNGMFASKGFPLISINPNSPEVSSGDSYDAMVKYAKQKGYTFPYLYDPSQKVASEFGATNTPHAFVLNKENGKLVVAYIGAIDDNASDGSAATQKYVELAVNALLAGKKVAVQKTKAIGCGVKWKNS